MRTAYVTDSSLYMYQHFTAGLLAIVLGIVIDLFSCCIEYVEVSKSLSLSLLKSRVQQRQFSF